MKKLSPPYYKEHELALKLKEPVTLIIRCIKSGQIKAKQVNIDEDWRPEGYTVAESRR